MKKIAVIFTSLGPLVNSFYAVLKETLPECEIIRIADDSLIADVKKQGGLNDSITKRTCLHIESAIEAGADTVVIACSSVGEVAKYADARYPVRVMRIDEGMMEAALAAGKRIGVIASLATTIEPTVNLLRAKADELGAQCEITSRVAEGAYEALNGGSPERHDEIITKVACEMAQNEDVLILAQGSMARLEKPLNDKLSVPVLASPRCCAEHLRKLMLREKEGVNI